MLLQFILMGKLMMALHLIAIQKIIILSIDKNTKKSGNTNHPTVTATQSVQIENAKKKNVI